MRKADNSNTHDTVETSKDLVAFWDETYRKKRGHLARALRERSDGGRQRVAVWPPEELQVGIKEGVPTSAGAQSLDSSPWECGGDSK